MPDLSDLQALRQLDIQSNRLTSLGSGERDGALAQHLLLMLSHTNIIAPLLHSSLYTYTGLQNLTQLEELYLACNHLQSLEGLPRCLPADTSASPALNTLDVTTNKIDNVEAVIHLSSLEEFWMSSNLIASPEALRPLQALPVLSCLYLEHSPLQKSLSKEAYKTEVLTLLPGLTQLDAAMIR